MEIGTLIKIQLNHHKVKIIFLKNLYNPKTIGLFLIDISKYKTKQSIFLHLKWIKIQVTHPKSIKIL
jgi:hypothetical protein